MSARTLQIATLCLSSSAFAFQDDNPTPKLAGFGSQAAQEQLRIEALLAASPSPDSARKHHRILTEEPHIEGTPQQRRVAEYVLNAFRTSDISAELVEYQAYLSYPKEISVSLIEPDEVELTLEEAGFRVDKDSYSRDIVPGFHAYSPSAEIEAEVVYVNYGLPGDYARLTELGVDVRGRIVLVRYGESFRGVKVKEAEVRGAAGVIIYSDPMDDGYFKGDVYPDGPMRPPSGIQRGSVEYLFVYPGDPLTPGRAARGDVARLTPEEATNIPRIPSIPMSYQEAGKILRTLAGTVVPENWQGALGFTYHVGPGPARIRLRTQMDAAVRPVWNVIARIPGSTYPDEWVILGNHIDAWTYGAVDPSSGTTVLLELARALGELHSEGHSPKRTVILAAWGGEEFGLIGSTEWGEENREELMRKTVAYLNVDVAVAGTRFSASSVPLLEEVLREVTGAVRDPRTREPVYDTWLASQHGEGDPSSAGRADATDLGSGSDYTVFLDHLGIPSLSMSFLGPYGVYHSKFDSHRWMSLYGDPGWSYHPAMTEIWGRLALRLANADILPFNYGEYGEAIDGYLNDIEGSVTDPSLDLNALREEAQQMRRIGSEIRSGVESLLRQPIVFEKTARINELFRQAERGFLLDTGLRDRPWYRHAIYAPGLHTGYASQPLPGLSDALSRKDPDMIREETRRLLVQMKKVNRTLDQIRRLTQ